MQRYAALGGKMDISVFEVLGPVMIGPSSSSTAGMARLGWVTGKFVNASNEDIAEINLKFHPRHMDYAGTRSHLGLIGGVLGMREYDNNLKYSLDKAKELGIRVTASCFKEPLPKSGLTVATTVVLKNGERTTVTGVSVGGGSIDIIGINDFTVNLSATEKHIFIWADRNIFDKLYALMPDANKLKLSINKGHFLFYSGVSVETDENSKLYADILAMEGVEKIIFIDPFLSFGSTDNEKLFTSFEQLMSLSKESGKDIAELAIEYEMQRSGRAREDIWEEMAKTLYYMRETVDTGLNGEVKTLFGFDPGDDGKKMMHAFESGRTLSGSTMARAFAKAMATMEVGESMGRIVAAPTGGSAGIVPGCLLTVQEDKGYSDEELIRALFAAAAAGIGLYYHEVSFSGMGGGCQGEIGVSSAIAASALAYLGGADTEGCCHAMALAMKNILGLVCDRIAGSSEIPCTTRNCIGVANAFAGCDMALAGIRSYVSPDSVAVALRNTENLLPAQLRGGEGALRITPESKKAREIEDTMNKSQSLPVVDCF